MNRLLQRYFLVLFFILTCSLPDVFSQTGSWAKKADFGGSERSGAVSFVINGKAYVGTGLNYTDYTYKKDFWEYDPSTNVWTQKADFGGDERAFASGFSLNGKGYLGTGSDKNFNYRKDFWEYNPITNSWLRKADVGGLERIQAAGFSVGGKGFIVTGVVASPTNSFNNVELWQYDPVADNWVVKAPFPGSGRAYAAAITIGNNAFVGTGVNLGSGTNYKDFWRYDPESDVWAKKADFGGTARAGTAYFVIESKGYVGLGIDNLEQYYKNDIWEYDPSTDIWAKKADYPANGRNYSSGFAVGQKGYVALGTEGRMGIQDKPDLWEFSRESLLPVISSFMPLAAGADSAVTITGLNFANATAVSFGNTPAKTFTVISPTIIKAVVSSGTSGSVSVTTPLGTGTKEGFTFMAHPIVSSFIPVAARADSTITITGLNFGNATGVSFGNTPAKSFTVISPTTIKAIVSSGTSGSVSVTTPLGAGTKEGFIFIDSPIISSFIPLAAPADSTVTITGLSFTNVTGVKFGITPAKSFNVISPTVIKAVVASGSSGSISVTTQYGTATKEGFTFIARPGIMSFSPLSAAANDTVTISGVSFYGVTAVKFGGIPAASFAVISPTTIKAITGNGATGEVSVSTPAGVGLKNGFTFISSSPAEAPTVTSFSPTIVYLGGLVTITGTNFGGATAVKFGGVPALYFSVASPTTIKAVAGDNAISGEVTVATPAGTASLPGLTILPRPTLKAISVTPEANKTKVSIVGTGFGRATAVYFARSTSSGLETITASSFHIVSDTEITAEFDTKIGGGIIRIGFPTGTLLSGGVQNISYLANLVRTYGDAPFIIGAVTSSGKQPTFISGDTTIVQLANGKVYIKNAGIAKIGATVDSTTNFIKTTIYQDLVVQKKLLTVTCENKEREFNTSDPTFTALYNGFANNDSLAVINKMPVFNTNASSASNVGEYTIKAHEADAANYTFKYIDGKLTVKPAKRIFTFNTIPVKTFDTADFNLGAQVNTGETIYYTSSDTSVILIIDNKAHIRKVGVSSIIAIVKDSSNYIPVTPLIQNLTVKQASQTITFEAIPVLEKKSAPYMLRVSASSGLPVTLVISDPVIAALEQYLLSPKKFGTADITATQPGNHNYLAALPAIRSLKVVNIDKTDTLAAVHPALSINGDGINDFLYIEAISDYKKNTLSIMNMNGVVVYETQNYNNTDRVFAGKSNLSGENLPQGTYFYLLTFKVNGEEQRKTGFFILKY